MIPTTYDHDVPPSKTNTAPAPALGNAHQWVATAIFSISPHAVEQAAAAWMAGHPSPGIELDHENLLTVQGPACIKCQQQLTPTTHAQPCPVRVVPLLRFA